MTGHESLGHETSDAHIIPIIATATGLAISAALIGWLVYGIFHYLAGRPVTTAPPNPMAAADQQFPPLPRIEEHPATELQQLRAQEEQTLSSYGWVDKNAGTVRIPIDRAIDLALDRKFALSGEAAKQ
jgi:hypothetical protein